jgi:hypothetical protein
VSTANYSAGDRQSHNLVVEHCTPIFKVWILELVQVLNQNKLFGKDGSTLLVISDNLSFTP